MENEDDDQWQDTISNPRSSMDSPPPRRSHRDRKPFSPPAESSADSTVSSDRTSHGFFSPREHKNSSPTLEPMSFSTLSSDRTSHGFFSPRVDKDSFRPPETITSIAPVKLTPSPDSEANESISDERAVEVMKVDPGAGAGFTAGRTVEEVTGSGSRKARPALSILRRTRMEKMVKRTALGIRVCGMVFSMISFSVMASDKNRGWSLDSYDRYKEFRYCLSVNVIAFIYSGVQACDLAYHLTAKTIVARRDLRCFFDFFMDQMLTYLLISASSSAATRVDDWESNWGEDKFPQMATASVAMSFLAVVALACSSLISGYTLCCTLKST